MIGRMLTKTLSGLKAVVKFPNRVIKSITRDVWFFIAAFIALCLIAVGYVAAVHFALKLSWQDSGTFGDTFGALNVIFSGMASLGVIYAIMLQRKDLEAQSKQLEMQQEELKLTREQMKRSADAIEEQANHLKTQTKLADLAKAIDALHHQIVEALYLDKTHYPSLEGNEVVTAHGEQIFLDPTFDAWERIVPEAGSLDRYSPNIKADMVPTTAALVRRCEIASEMFVRLDGMLQVYVNMAGFDALKLISDSKFGVAIHRLDKKGYKVEYDD